MKEDYIENYESFWKSIVENEDGTLNKDQIMRELYDYSIVMNNCSLAYCMMTKQNISKQTTYFSEVEGLFYQFYLDKDVAKEDIKSIIDSSKDIDELRKEIEDYFVC